MQKAPARGLSVGTGASVKTPTDYSSTAVQTSIPPSIDLVLSRLDQVRQHGQGYTARCPAHNDRSASLSVACGDDGRILMHCFAGCGIHDVVGAVGLTVSDLFPRRLTNASPEARKELQVLALKSQVKACANVLELESGVVLIAASDIGQGRVLTDSDHARLALACERIRAARVAIGGTR
ncbi:MAG: CHC2 zinc finger domain-containing protein [Lysobacterales bacterium]